jgi:hypothetical protein
MGLVKGKAQPYAYRQPAEEDKTEDAPPVFAMNRKVG